MAKRRSETEESIRQLNSVVEDLIRSATATELPLADSRVLAFISDRRLLREYESEDQRSSE